MIKNLIVLLLVLSGINQLAAQRHTLDTIVKDFNNDKVLDTLINSYGSGSACGGRTVSIVNGKTKKKFKLSNYGCYATFTKKIRIPENLTSKSNHFFLDALKEKLLPKKRDSMGSSLKWLISGELNSKRLDSHPLFDIIANPKTNWQSTILNMPKTYYVTIYGDTLQKLETINKEHSISKKGQGFLVYYTIGHHIKTLDSLAPVTQNKEYQVYKTDHAIFVKKGSTYRWVFISDSNITGAPDRHSWVSINQIEIIGNYLIIHQSVPPGSYNIVVVNIETQKVGRLAFEPSSNNGTDVGGMNTFNIKDNLLKFTEYGNLVLKKIPLKEIFNTLDEF